LTYYRRQIKLEDLWRLTFRFESPAERIAYPIIRTIAIQNKLEFEYQKKFGFKSGGYRSKEDYCEDNDLEYYDDGDYDDWEDSSWSCELYRADFVLFSDKLKLIVEIDGKEFHKKEFDWQVRKEKSRDRYFKNKGFDVLHIPANEVESYLLKDKILEYIKSRSE